MHKCSDPNLYVNLVVCGSVYGTIEAKPNHKYPSVYRKPEKNKHNRNII